MTLSNGDAWRSKPHRFWFTACAICLSLYLSYVLFLAQSPVFTGALATALSLAWFMLFAALLFAGMLLACRRLAKRAPKPAPVRQKLELATLLPALAIPLVIFACGLLRCYPGGMSTDANTQWLQVQSGQFSNWHPVFHTLLMWLGTRLHNSYPLLVAEQLALLSLALAYLVGTLRSWGAKRWVLLLIEGILVASPLVGNTAMHMWKDNAMTIGALLLLAQTTNAYLSRGEWLEKPRNVVALGLTLAFTTLVRHNAFLLTVPLLLTLMLCYRSRWKRTLIAAAVMIGCAAFVLGPVYSWVGVTYPDNTFEESVGVPLTILGDVRVKNPDALTDEARAYLDRMATDEEWRTIYQPGNYNSIKFVDWEHRRLRVIDVDKADYFRMVADTVKADPRDALLAVNEVTDLVWGVTENEANVSSVSASQVGDYRYLGTRVNELGKSLMRVFDVPMGVQPIRWYVGNIGVSFALMLLVAVYALYRNGVRALTLCVPPLLYNLGTMCMLCGNDARFFQYSLLWCTFALVPLLRSPDAK